MNNMMPDAISPMGRAVQAKTEGMTPDQVATLDQQYAKMGLMSINDVLTLKQQLDAMKQSGQQAGPPPTTTVTQDLQQQLGGGITALPSNVGNEAAYARGGIVAFADAGLVGGATQAPGFGQYVDEALRGPQGAQLKSTLQAAEQAAAKAPPAARKAILSRMLGGVVGFAKRNPYILAASIGLPIVLSFLRDGDSEQPAEPAQAPPPDQPPMDLSGILEDARQRSMSGGITAALPGAGSMPDVAGAFAPVVKSAQENLDANQLQARPDIEKTMNERFSGLTGHVDAREAALQAQQARLDAADKDKFWNSMAKGFFGMAGAGGGDGATFAGAMGEGGLKGLEEYQRLGDKYEADRTKLDDSMFGVGEARAAHKRGIIAATDTEENAQRSREDAARAQLFEVQARQTEAYLNEYGRMLDRRASMAIASARNQGLTGMELLQEAAAIVGMKGDAESQRALTQITDLMEKIGKSSLSAVLGAYARNEGELVPGMPMEGTGRVIGARPAGQ